VKSAFGFGNDAARAEARRAESEFNARTVEDAHKQRLASYQKCLREQLQMQPGIQRTGPNEAYMGIPSGLFDSGFAPLTKKGAGCLIGIWVQIGERAGRLSGGHAFAVKPTHDVDGYAVFDPNCGEVIFESASNCSYFLGGFIGRANQFIHGAWMIQQYLGCSPAAEEIDEVFGGLGGLVEDPDEAER
jgi:hypothetical protein